MYNRIIAFLAFLIALISLGFIAPANAYEGENWNHDRVWAVRGSASIGFVFYRTNSADIDYVEVWAPAWWLKDECREEFANRPERRRHCVADVREDMEWARTLRVSIERARTEPDPFG